MGEIPSARDRAGQSGPAGGAHPVGWLQVPPPSVLRQTPPSLAARNCGSVVAMIVSGANDAIATSTVMKLGKPSRCCQLCPPSKVRKSPPVSVATTIRRSLLEATAIDKARPPWATVGGEITTVVAQPARSPVSVANPAAIRARRITMATPNLRVRLPNLSAASPCRAAAWPPLRTRRRRTILLRHLDG